MIELDERGIDTVELKSELAETNKRIEKESDAMRSYVACRIGW